MPSKAKKKMESADSPLLLKNRTEKKQKTRNPILWISLAAAGIISVTILCLRTFILDPEDPVILGSRDKDISSSWTKHVTRWISLFREPHLDYLTSRMSEVFLYSLLGMFVTGLGALPFWFFDFRDFSKSYIGYANAIAAGVMISASFGLIQEGFEVDGNSEYQTLIGVMIGLGVICFCHDLIDHNDVDIGHLHGANAKKAFLVLAIMTIHSFAEGMGIGLSFCGSQGARTGKMISLAMAVHNIPEGLAIALVLLPKGESIGMTTVYCILSSAPQPLISIPSFLLVQYFQLILPYGFGIAAGAMLWLTIAEILPEAFESHENSSSIASVVVSSMAVMAAFQSWIHHIM